MFIAGHTSQQVYGSPVKWKTQLRIDIITSWCKLLPPLFLSHSASISLSLGCFTSHHQFNFLLELIL